MNQREKVIKGWERCQKCEMSLTASDEGRKAYLECEYTVGMYCGKDKLISETIELLKAQEPVPPEMEGGGFSWYPVCGACHGVIGDMDSYCKHCGTPVLKEKAKPHHNKGGEEE